MIGDQTIRAKARMKRRGKNDVFLFASLRCNRLVVKHLLRRINGNSHLEKKKNQYL